MTVTERTLQGGGFLSLPEATSSRAVQDNFRKRLRTFSPATYFAKPTTLSPIICARFGWANVDKDLLECSCCRAAWSIVFPRSLSTESTDNLTAEYLHQLVTAHEEYCMFRRETHIYIEGVNSKNQSHHSLPPALASVLPNRQLLLLEHPSPKELFCQEIDTILESIINHFGENLSLPEMNLPAQVQDFLVCESSSEQSPASSEPLLSRLYKSISVEADELAESVKRKESSIALVLFGWMASLEKDDTDPNRMYSECPLCLSLHAFQVQGMATDIPDSLSVKRQRMHSPFDAHSYYCPFVCHIGDKPPLWQAMATRMLVPKKHMDADSAFLDARGVLLDALSPKFRQGI
jgi:hypothetical protein